MDARKTFAALGVLGVVFPLAIAFACIHTPESYKGGPVSEREKLALLFHDGVDAHLAIRTSLKAEGGLPGTMAWVIPLPSLPAKYEEVSPELFEELFALIPRNDPRVPRVMAAAKEEPAAPAPAAAPEIVVHEKRIVGSYAIQPIEIVGDSAGKELNEWLTKNGFGAVPPENQRYYLHKGAAFIALRVDGLKGQESELKPLHIVYRDDKMRLPLKFSTHSGVFDVRCYVVTAKAPSRAALRDFGLEVMGVSFNTGSGGTLGERAPAVAKLLGDRRGFVTEFRGSGYNESKRVADWKEDPWLDPNGNGPGGPAGGEDSAGSWPGYPLVGFKPANNYPGASREADKNWLWPIAFNLVLLASLWWFYRTTRTIAAAISDRPAADVLPAAVGNRIMILSIVTAVVWVAVLGSVYAWNLWGSLVDFVTESLGWGALVVAGIGAILRVGAPIVNWMAARPH
ncbi:MAG TPA: DUF2330 domain-containing protein [Burkholderiales bacterium]